MNTRSVPSRVTRPLIRAAIEATLLTAAEFGIDLSGWRRHEDVGERRRSDGMYRRSINWSSRRDQSKAYSRAILRPRAPWRIEVELMLWHEKARVTQWVSYNPLSGRAALMNSPSE